MICCICLDAGLSRAYESEARCLEDRALELALEFAGRRLINAVRARGWVRVCKT